MRSVINILDLSVEEIDELIATAYDIMRIQKNIRKNVRVKNLQPYFLSRRRELGLVLRLQCLNSVVAS